MQLHPPFVSQKMYRVFLLFAALLLSPITNATQSKTIKHAEIHYSAFNSTFLTPQVARQYQLQRNPYNAIINISVLNQAQLGKPAIPAKITGIARNLIGQQKDLVFRQIQEGQAIYYLAEFSISHEETFTFMLHLDAGLSGSGKLNFTQKFYVEE